MRNRAWLRSKQTHVRGHFASGRWLKILAMVRLSRLRVTPWPALANRYAPPPDLAHWKRRGRHANRLRNALSRKSVSYHFVGDHRELSDGYTSFGRIAGQAHEKGWPFQRSCSDKHREVDRRNQHLDLYVHCRFWYATSSHAGPCSNCEHRSCGHGHLALRA